jgi:protein tyrosine/serine phosphatase
MLENRYLYSSFVDAYGREVLARYFFESEFVNIPNTEMSLEVDAGNWATFENDNLALYKHDQFLEIFNPVDRVAKNYLEFVLDSISSDYVPMGDNLSEALIETAEEFIEKEISLSFISKVKLIWDLVLGKKIYISKY